jgi:hypothetical protein
VRRGHAALVNYRLDTTFRSTLLEVLEEPVLHKPDTAPNKLKELFRHLYKREPVAFAKVIVSALPKEVHIEHGSAAADMRDEEIDRLLEYERAMIDITPAKALIDGRS